MRDGFARICAAFMVVRVLGALSASLLWTGRCSFVRGVVLVGVLY